MSGKFLYHPPANGYEEWNNNPEIYQINRMEPHVDVIPYDSRESAIKGRKEDSASYLSLNGPWKFKLYPNPSQRDRAFINNPCTDWEEIAVPSHWQLQGYDQPRYTNIKYPWHEHDPIVPPFAPINYNPVGCYVRTFTLPDNWDNRVITLSFQGVESAFYCWLNGDFVGYSEDSFTPAEFDITPYLVPGENRLAVEVYRWCDGSWLEDMDHFRLSGIFRDVYLYSKPRCRICDFKVITELDSVYRDAFLDTDISINNYDGGDVSGKILFELHSPEGDKVLAGCEPFNCTGQTRLRKRFYIEDPKKWSAETPHLYTLVLRLQTGEGDEILRSKVGFRSFEIKNARMLINGCPIMFKGMNRHEWDPVKGRAINYQDTLNDIRLLKQNNINAVRTSHYPNQQAFYDLCDEYGIYVMDEASIETHGTWRYGQTHEEWDNVPGSKPWWTAAVIDRVNSMYHRDKNHPSVLIWSLGNESHGGENFVKMHDFLHTLDSRPVHYEGIFHSRGYSHSSDMESQMYTTPAELEAYAQKNTGKPIILCEYCHGTGNSCGNLVEYTDLFARMDIVQGGFIWDWKDKALLSKTKDGKPYYAYGGDFGDTWHDANLGCNGMFFADGQPKAHIFEVKKCYQDVSIKAMDLLAGKFLLTNGFLFRTLEGLALDWRIEINGVLFNSCDKLIPLSADAGESEEIALALGLPKLFNWQDEAVLTVRVLLDTDTPWAPRGHEMAFWQFILPVERRAEEKAPSCAPQIIEDSKHSLNISAGSHSIGFCKATGELCSYKLEGDEIFITSPAPYFWRAITDNDNTTGHVNRSGIWRHAGRDKRLTHFVWRKTEEAVHVETHFVLLESAKCTLYYDITHDGAIKVTFHLYPDGNLPIIPAIGVMLTLPNSFNQLAWYGNGPHESYWDRQEGVRLGLYDGKIKEQYEPHIRPQENGNKTGVRYAKIKDDHKTLCIKGLPELELSALPFTPEEIEGQKHAHELPETGHTVLRINFRQMGLGGDRGWGNDPVAHSPYLLYANRGYVYSFVLHATKDGC